MVLTDSEVFIVLDMHSFSFLSTYTVRVYDVFKEFPSTVSYTRIETKVVEFDSSVIFCIAARTDREGLCPFAFGAYVNERIGLYDHAIILFGAGGVEKGVVLFRNFAPAFPIASVIFRAGGNHVADVIVGAYSEFFLFGF